MKLRTKFLLHIFLAILLIFIAAGAYINYKYGKFIERLSIQTTGLNAKLLAQKVEGKLKSDMAIIEGMREIFEFYIEQNPQHVVPDQLVKNILHAVLKNNPDFLATWYTVELHFIDPELWVQFHGRKRIAAYMDNGQVKFYVDTVDVDNENTQSPYYKVKVGLYKSIITDPYFFSYNPQDTLTPYLETSLGKGLYYRGQFVGMVGIDLYLGKISEFLLTNATMPHSQPVLVSTSGKIVAHPNHRNYGKKLTAVYPELRRYNILDSILAAKAFYLIVEQPQTHEPLLFYFSPIIAADKGLPWSLIYIVPLNKVLENVRRTLAISALANAFAILLGLILIWIFITQITKRIERVTEVLKQLSKGIIDPQQKLPITAKDEIADMYYAVNQLIDSLINTVEFAQQIGSGNLDAYYELKSEEDVLGKALIEMKMNLKRVKEEEEQRLRESEQLNWVQRGITEVNEILRLHSNNLEELAFEVIKFLVKYTDSIQGGFYIIQKQEDKEKIKLLVAYAYDRKKQLEAEFEIGEGLVGRAVKERSPIVLTNLPQGYVYVKSGLGDETPDNLIIVPLIFEDEVFGAIELLSFKPYDQYKQEFLNQASYRIASSVSNIMKTLQTVQLLEQFQKQSEIIKRKEKTLEQRLNELAELKKEVEYIKQKYEKFFEAIGMSITIVEYNQDLVVVKVNDLMLELLQIEPADILGKRIDELLPEAKENPKWFERFVNDLKKGVVRKKVTKYSMNQRIIYLDEVYVPIADDQGNVTEVIVFGIDITKHKKKS